MEEPTDSRRESKLSPSPPRRRLRNNSNYAKNVWQARKIDLLLQQ